jgi:hypothetical protein
MIEAKTNRNRIEGSAAVAGPSERKCYAGKTKARLIFSYEFFGEITRYNITGVSQ